MRCNQCGIEFQAFPGEPCPRCGQPSPLDPAGAIGAPAAGGGPGEPGGSQPAAAPPGWGGSAGWAPTGGPPPVAGPLRDGPPWERGRSFENLFATLKGVLLLPSQTFRTASQKAGLGPALLYGMILGLAGGYAGLFWEFLSRRAMEGGGLPGFVENLGPEMQEAWITAQSPFFLLAYAICLPVLAAIGMFLWSAIVHLCLMMFGGARQGYEATFRTLAYAYGSTAIFQVVPICGGLVGVVWSLVVQIIGLKEMHETGGGKAAAAVLLPLLLCCCLCAAFFAMLAALGGLAALAGD